VVDTDVNPRTVGAVTIETSDLNGPTAQTDVVTWGAFTGLRMWHSSKLSFGSAASQVEVTLVAFATPAVATAYDGSGTVVSTATMTVGQQIPQTLVLTGAGIVTIVVESKADELLLQKLCWVAG
jgi:hypothetical protein